MDRETAKWHTSAKVAIKTTMITIQLAYLPYDEHVLIYQQKFKEIYQTYIIWP